MQCKKGKWGGWRNDGLWDLYYSKVKEGLWQKIPVEMNLVNHKVLKFHIPWFLNIPVNRYTTVIRLVFATNSPPCFPQLWPGDIQVYPWNMLLFFPYVLYMPPNRSIYLWVIMLSWLPWSSSHMVSCLLYLPF